jgi:phosphatidate cytidylyltransferase
MKIRIISALGGILFGISVLSVMFTPLYSAIIGLFVVPVAIHELETVVGIKNKFIRALSMLFGALVILYMDYGNWLVERTGAKIASWSVAGIFAIILLMVMLADHKNTNFTHAAMAFFTSILIPAALGTLILLRDVYITYPAYGGRKPVGFFFVLFGLISCWGTDTGAYFVGVKFGNHKMAPEISPKKSWEGAAGGVAFAALLNIALLAVFRLFFFEGIVVPYYVVIPGSIALSVISIFGDLCASAIKRNYGVKDYGKIMPGHGGVLDRFDSALFVLPAVCFMVMAVNLGR